MKDLLSLKEASIWASKYLRKEVTPSNISYLVQYGQIAKNSVNGSVLIDRIDLKAYYNEHQESKKNRWKEKLGNDLNWRLSFSEYKESETTKHVHRLHPYKGKFIPQLVEYFLDDHVDNFKRHSFFSKGDIVLDPFCGSGTTLVQANQLGIHAVGIDVSAFNSFISNIKVGHFDLEEVRRKAFAITQKLEQFEANKNSVIFNQQLADELKVFNSKFFPSPEFRYKVRRNEINETQYGKEKANEFAHTYRKLIDEYKIVLRQDSDISFLDKWFLKIVRHEIDLVFKEIQSIENPKTKKLLALVLSRTIRSCRATTHADLGTLKEPVTTTYFCKKHGKICKPLFSILNWWQRYSQDTIKRVAQFNSIRSDTVQKCLVGDSRKIDIMQELKAVSPKLTALAKNEKVAGIFSSPPYVGLIDYHEQHAYAYDLFGFERKDELEIGPLFKGQGLQAQKSYVKEISDVLINCKSVLKPNYHVFLVANDKNGLYSKIAERANMKIVNEYKRPVLNRVEKNRSAYAEIIFHLQEK